MKSASLPTFAELRSRYDDTDADRSSATVSMDLARRGGDDPHHVLSYLRSFGDMPTSLDDVARAVDELADEEELSAFRCREGVAVGHASDGWWVLFVDDPAPVSERAERATDA